MKRILILILILCAAAMAQDLPKIAVYVTSKMFDQENKVLETHVMSTIHKSGRYKVIDRSPESSNKLATEHIKQRDGSVNTEQIKRLGTQLGVDFICIPDITAAFGAWSISVRIINIETAEIVSMGTESSIEMYMNNLKQALDKVLGEMLSSQTTTSGAATASGPKMMKPKYDGTEIYATEYFAASGAPIAVVGQNDVLILINEGKNHYKVRTASGKEGFAVKKDLIPGGAQFVDMRTAGQQVAEGTAVVNTREETAAPNKEPDNKSRRLDNRISIDLGQHFAWASMDYSGFSKASTGLVLDANIRFDLIYADIDLALYNIAFAVQPIVTQNNHLLLKYPIDVESLLRVSPLLGISYTQMNVASEQIIQASSAEDLWFPLGVRVDAGVSKTFYVTTEYLYSFGVGGNASNMQSFKLGCGFDMAVGRRFYWRPEFMYHFTYMALSEIRIFYDFKSVEISKHTLGLYINMGWKFGGNKKKPFDT